MTGHANILELDEAAAGLADERLRAHLEACESCRAELKRVSTGRSELVADARFCAALDRLPGTKPKRRWAWALIPAAAASLAAVLLWPAPPHLRAKGDAWLQLVSRDGKPLTSSRAGDVAELRIAPGTHRFALVVTSEGPTQLWPPEAANSGALSPGEHASVSVKMTPGPIHVVAAFSDHPLTIAEALGTPPPDTEVRTLDIVTAP